DARLKLAQAEAAANTQRNDAIQLLISVASAPIENYARRASAAESLAALKAPASSLGSAELDWLIRGGPVPAAESPGFFHARLRAAREAADAATQIRLLLDAIAVRPEDFSQRFGASPPAAANPENVSPRILLSQAAAADNQNELAVSALTPLIDQSIMASPPPESPESEAPGEEMAREYIWRSFLAGQELSASRKSLIAAQMASAFQKLARLREAAQLLEVAIFFATDDSLRSKATHELEQLQAQMKLEQADRERRPVISDHLEQRGLVRPRPVPDGTAPRLLGRSGAPDGRGSAARCAERLRLSEAYALTNLFLASAGRLSLPAEARRRREAVCAGKPEAFRTSGGRAATVASAGGGAGQ